MNMVWKLLVLGIFVYAAIATFIYYQQPRLIYYPDMPTRELVATPQQIGLEFHDAFFKTGDNVKLHGWFIPHPQAKGTLLFFHGNAGNISHRLESIAIFHRLDLNVFIIDYRGYGQSEGEVSEQGTYRDAEAAWYYLKRTQGIDPEEIVIFGRSLGASIAGWLASKKTPAALIIESGFSSVPSMGKRFYPFLPVKMLTTFEYDTESYVRNIECPVLVAHSRTDDIIPYDEGRAIFDAAPDAKQFLEMRGGHNDGFMVSGQNYIDELGSFIHTNLGRKR